MPFYERIFNKQKREATIRMYGVIGRDINGNEMAHDLSEMDKEADTIHIRINSDGGSVSQGFSIVSAILSARAYIHVHVDGVAASMAAVIAVSGDKVTMQDYSKLMVHDPFFSGKGSDKLSAKDLKALDSIKDSLQTVLSRRGCDKQKIASLMKDETWLSAEDAQKAGLADEVVTTPRKQELGGLSTPDLMGRIMQEYKPKKSFKMNEIAKALGLPEDATEGQIVDAIRAKDKDGQDQLQKVVDSLLALGEKNGVVDDKNRDRMKRLAKADFGLFADMMSEVKEAEEEKEGEEEQLTEKKPQAEDRRLSEVINKAAKGKGKEGTQNANNGRTWDWYQKHDPEGLARMEREEPGRFNRLLDEYEQSID